MHPLYVFFILKHGVEPVLILCVSTMWQGYQASRFTRKCPPIHCPE